VPELPEVETIRRQLAPALEGRTLDALEVLDPRWCLPLAPEALRDAVEGRRVVELDRRGKYLVLALEGDVFLLLHLRMTGTLLLDPSPAGGAPPPYERVRFAFDGGAADLRFCDPRRFGTGELAVGVGARDAFLAARLGLEPLSGELDGASLHRLSRGRRAPVKAFLLDQRHVAGVGNIYADEALFRARLHPLRPAGSLTRAQCDALAGAVRAALEAGIDAGGATIDDFRHADGVRGSFQDEFLVHRRRGEPCPACGGEVVKFVAAGRGTYACERCQPRPRRRRAAARAGSVTPRARPGRAAGRSGRPGRAP
jgi:formamidopyrimidine-DNA glycosylase